MTSNSEQLQINSNEYFTSYEDLNIHELMLTDSPRQEAYRRAIFENKRIFKNKIVLDVGSGTGILSILCAQAGASRVLAVEASNVAKLSRQIIDDNGFHDKIEVFETKIEDFCLPAGIDKVDIIISEWMGFYLLHEGMLDSVIFARDRFLKSGGIIFPETASIYITPCSVPTRFGVWENISGVNMSSFAKHMRQEKSQKPEIMDVKEDDLLHEGTVLAWIDLRDISTEDLNEFSFKEVIVVQKPGKYEGVCLWFYCSFPNADNDNEQVVLSTSPKASSTHWKQTVLLLPEIACESLEIGDPIAISLEMKRNDKNSRRYNLQLELLDPEKIEHNLPCDCIMTKCILTKKHFELMEIENQE